MQLNLDHALKAADMALDKANRLGASYVDVRMHLRDESESIYVKNDVVEAIVSDLYSGFGIRVLKNGGWGFASFSDLALKKDDLESKIKATVKEAVSLAEVSAKLRSFPLKLAPISGLENDSLCRTPFEIDPFRVPTKEKIELLRHLCAKMGGDDRIIVRSAGLGYRSYIKFFASSENGVGRYLYQTFMNCLLEMDVTAYDKASGEVQDRSLGHGGFGLQGGFELIDPAMMEITAEELKTEALALLDAPECTPGIKDIIIMPQHLGLHVHETGHAFEGDRLLGYEQTYVGGTFINEILPQIGSYQFGSEAVNIVADARYPGGYGTFGYDDEGVPAQSFPLVEKGVIKNVLTSRESVSQINRRMGREYFKSSNGTMRAASYTRMPLIRMTNINLLPGKDSLESLVARVDDGLLLDGTASWSMSEDRKNFDFGLEYAREIKRGVVGRLVRNAGYTGDNLAFWKSCEAVASPEQQFMLNVPNCGKGMPGQSMTTGHLSSPALFRGVQVYNRKNRGGNS